jgi:hypothetical protein
MSGFFWLGYWSAASSDYPADPFVISEPREKQPTSPSDDRNSPSEDNDESKDESSAEASSKEQATEREYHHWVEL